MQPDDFAPGAVWLVGAGPAEPFSVKVTPPEMLESVGAAKLTGLRTPSWSQVSDFWALVSLGTPPMSPLIELF